jgi:replicative DNA helicase
MVTEASEAERLAGELQRLFERIDDRNEAEDLIGWEASAADLAQLLTDKSRRDLILSALRHPPSDEWRAIETAPKATDDYGIGPWLLLFVPEGLDAPNMVTVGTYFREELRDDQGRFLGGEWTAVDADMMRSAYIKPTHWKPLPPPPREGER